VEIKSVTKRNKKKKKRKKKKKKEEEKEKDKILAFWHRFKMAVTWFCATF